jgi:hypothetical protein
MRAGGARQDSRSPAMTIPPHLPTALTLARSAATTGLLWAGWTAFQRWKR